MAWQFHDNTAGTTVWLCIHLQTEIIFILKPK